MAVYTKIIDLELSNPKLEKSVLSPPASHKPSANNSTQISILSILDNKHITTNKNKNNISNIDDIQSCITPRRQNYSAQATSMPTHLTPLDATLSITFFKLHTATKLTPAGREYLCFQIIGKYSQAADGVKFNIMTKMFYSILSIDTFEQKCVVLKGMLQSPHLKNPSKTIGIEQSVINRASFEHK